MSSATPSSGPMKPMPNPRPEPGALAGLRRHPDDVEFGCGGVDRARDPRRRAGPLGRLLARRVGHATARRRSDWRSAGTARGAPGRVTGADRTRRRCPPRGAGRPRDPPGRRDPAAASGHRPGPDAGREPAPRPLSARAAGARRRPDRPVRRRRGAARARRRTPSSSSSSTRCRPRPSPATSRPSSSTCRPRRSWPPGPPRWKAHATQVKARPYVEMQLTRARVNGLRAGVGHAIALYPNDPPVVDSLAHWAGARADSDMEPRPPAPNRHHLLPLGRGQRHPRVVPGRRPRPPRARSALHQLRAPFPAPAGRAPRPLPPGGHQRLRPVQVSRLHPAALGEDGRGEPRASARRAARPLRRAARDGRHPRAVDAAARAAARRSSPRCTAPTPPCSAATRATARRSAMPWSAPTPSRSCRSTSATRPVASSASTGRSTSCTTTSSRARRRRTRDEVRQRARRDRRGRSCCTARTSARSSGSTCCWRPPRGCARANRSAW